MKILFITPYPFDEAPSQRFRFEQYLSLFHKKGYSYEIEPFFSLSGWQILYNSGKTFSKLNSIVIGYFKRFFLLFKIYKFDFVFIHREATPIGPPIIEWFVAKIFRKKIIYDFDDAIWTTDNNQESLVMRTLKCRWKVGLICKMSYKVSCGNRYLQSYSLKFNPSSFIIPTTINTELTDRLNHTTADKDIIIGWTGTHSTLKYLQIIEPVLVDIEKKNRNVSFVVIANKQPNLRLNRLNFFRWTKANELSDLQTIDIGLMPLPDDEWSKGKCGFKALQYMALGIPAVASPVGVNVDIINNGITGFLPLTEQDWFNSINALISDDKLREQMGRNAKAFVESHYSTRAVSDSFLKLFS